MAGKRTASSDLNHDNWDQDDEVEYAGTFQKASEEALKKRVIKTAKRRAPQLSTEDGDKKSVFDNFTGFSKFAPPNPNASFSFLSNTNTSTITSNSITKTPPGELQNGSVTVEKKSPLQVAQQQTSETKKDEGNNEYYAKLKGLNESVLSWIDKHVKENPFINLKPIFTDYERYLTDLETKYIEVDEDTKKELATFSFKAPTSKVVATSSTSFVSSSSTIFGGAKEKPAIFVGAQEEQPKTIFGATDKFKFMSTPIKEKSSTMSTPGTFTFGAVPVKDKDNTTINTIKFGATPQNESDSSTPKFVFGSMNAAKSAAPGTEMNKPFTFSTSNPISATGGSLFGGTPSFSFANTTPVTAPETVQSVDEDEDEPPKAEFTPVVEENHLYSIRCKVFVKKEESYSERGVGTLYLKQVPDSEKVQLIVRADTNLGNLICNFILSESIPCRRLGKKDVMLVCVPSPESKPPPVPLLFRVKSPEDAEALYNELNKHKK